MDVSSAGLKPHAGSSPPPGLAPSRKRFPPTLCRFRAEYIRNLLIRRLSKGRNCARLRRLDGRNERGERQQQQRGPVSRASKNALAESLH
jgi:hypothetical protein